MTAENDRYERLVERVVDQLDFVTRVVLDVRDSVRRQEGRRNRSRAWY